MFYEKSIDKGEIQKPFKKTVFIEEKIKFSPLMTSEHTRTGNQSP